MCFVFMVSFYVLCFAPHLFIHPYLHLGYDQYIGMTGCTLVHPKKIVCDDESGEDLVSLA
jgi:hypothetical protein